MTRNFVTFSVLALSLAMGLNAASITYNTPGAAVDTNGDPVDASATFLASAGQLTITLDNLQANIKDAGQLLTDLEFTLNVGGTNALSSSSATTIFVNSGGSFTTGTTGSTGWGFGTNGSNSIVCIICGTSTLSTTAQGAPSHGIIGPAGPGGVYSSANGSIAGNGGHNPFLDQTATFTITNSSITSDTTVTSAIFSFGTTFGDDITGVPGTPRTSDAPEPLSLGLFGVGLLGVGFVRSRRRAQQ